MSSIRLAVSRLRVFTPLLALGLAASASYGQTQALSVPRIQGAVNESQLAPLKGNTLSLTKRSVDAGLVPDATPTGHMLMVLKRSDAQQTALSELLAAQQDPNNPSFHKWLTPEEFGAQFGVADADIQSVTSYLSAQGFTVNNVLKSKMGIEFSGTAGQVRSAFHTEIHSYVSNGQSFHANASDPQIPSAMTAVVTGLTLNNYQPAMAHGAQKALLDRGTGKAHSLYANTQYQIQSLSPGDLGVLYDIPTSTYKGTGVTVGVISDSNINLAIPANYRTLFGLAANAPTVIVDGNDPGITIDADITYQLIETLSAVAPRAKINLYTSANTAVGPGLAFASIRAVDDGAVQVLAMGFESCEANLLGSNLIALYDRLWEQAAAQGISVVVSSGDGGAASCDALPPGPPLNTVATKGLAINGYAVSQYATAVGPSDFYYGPTGTVNLSTLAGYPAQYWSPTGTGFNSLQSYIPEQPNNSSDQSNNQVTYSPVIFTEGGGYSTVGNPDGSGTAYPAPTYQGVFTGADARAIPDISFFGGTLNNGSAYIFCIDAADCVNGSAQSLTYTSAGGSPPAAGGFAGVAALLVQAKGVQGNLNPGLYTTYIRSSSAFHDIVSGGNDVVCASGSPDCGANNLTTQGGGVLAFPAQSGYDPASGLGSVDVAKFISAWKNPTGTATVSYTLATNPSHHDQANTLTVTVTGTSGSPSGNVVVTTNVAAPSSHALATQTLASGKATFSNIGALLPVGTYQLTVRYSGDTHYAAASSTQTVYVYSVQGGLREVSKSFTNGQTLPYGTPVSLVLQAYDASSATNELAPTGSVAVSDNGNPVAVIPLNSLGFATFSTSSLAPGNHTLFASYSGDATFGNSTLVGDIPKVTIAGAPTTTTLASTDPTGASRNSITYLVATVTPSSSGVYGAAPAGTVQFSTTGGASLGTATLNLGANAGTNPASSAVLNLTRNSLPLGATSVVATYTPSNSGTYTGSSSGPLALSVAASTGLATTTTTLSTTPTNAINFIDTATVVFDASIASGNGTTATGSVNFYSNGNLVGSAPVASTGVASFTLPKSFNTQYPSASVLQPFGQSVILAQYTGDATHAASSTSYTINIYDESTTPDFTMQTDQAYGTIGASTTSASFTMQFTSLNGFAALGLPITLSYKAPAGITCSGSPAAPSFGGSNYAAITYTCGASSGTTVAKADAPQHPRSLWVAEGGAALACILLFGLPARRRSWQTLMGTLALCIVAFGISGCGASVNSGPYKNYYDLLNGNSTSAAVAKPNATLAKGTYTVLVTATSRVLTRSQSNVTVNLVHNLPLQIVVQ